MGYIDRQIDRERRRGICQLRYIGERSVCRPRGFRITIGADGSEGYFLLGSF